eukprot:scaffold18782_cov118-Isochrysis_galbana.AAC.4
MGIPSSPKRPRDPAQDNKVSPRAAPFAPAPAMLESQLVTTEYLSREPVRACQSLAHHTTLTGRCRKSVDTWAPLCEESQSRSTTTKPAERLGNHGNNAPPAQCIRPGRGKTEGRPRQDTGPPHPCALTIATTTIYRPRSSVERSR